jgi:uncharacterized protein (TIGR03066 family)
MKRITREDRRSKLFRWRPDHATAPVDHEASPTAVKRGGGKARPWLFLLLCLCGATVTSFVIFKYIAPSIVAPSLPPELVGTWQVTEGDLKGATLEFRWHGTALATSYNKQGNKETVQSSVEVDGRKILLTSKDAEKGTTETLTQTILKLTEDELVLRDEDQKTYRLVRVGN